MGQGHDADFKSERLGIKATEESNNILLAKWEWRFISDDNAMWRKFLLGVQGLEGCWDSSLQFQCQDSSKLFG